MASLKEIRARIASVNTTRKITSAMKMVSAAKLRKTEDMTLQFLPYKDRLTDVLARYLGSVDPSELNIPLSEAREVKKVAIIAVSSNTGLCGAFNSNASKMLAETVRKHKEAGHAITVYPIGKKIAEYAKRLDCEICRDYIGIGEKPTYETASELARFMVDRFLQQDVDKVELVYNHYKNAGSQEVRVDQYLPLETLCDADAAGNKLYFVEPDPKTFIDGLLPIVVRMRMYATLLDSLTAEHGARTTAMQIASDNAGELLGTITTQYNRARQEVITTELIDIVGGSEALKG